MENKKKLKEIRVLYVANSNFPSKAAHTVQIMNMCDSFSKFSKVDFLSFVREKEKIIFAKYNIIFGNFKIHGIEGGDKNYYFREFLLLKSLLFEKKSLMSDIDLIFTRSLLFSFLIKVFFLKKKVFYEIHDDVNEGNFKFFLKIPFLFLSFFFSDKLIFTNKFLYQRYKKFIFLKKKKIILENGVNLIKFDIKIDSIKIRKKFNLKKSDKIITYVGGFQKWKGIDLFLDCARKNPNLTFLVAGGECPNKIKNLICLGHISQKELPEVLKISNILVIPNSGKFLCSEKLTSPLKLFEYMASRTPIIASKVSSIQRIVSNDEVLFFKPDDLEDLSLKIDYLLKDKLLQKNLSKNAYLKSLEYSNEKRAEKILNLF